MVCGRLLDLEKGMLRKILCGLSIILCANSFATSCQYSEPSSKLIFGKNLDIIGDSISEQAMMRCKLRDEGLQFDFSGSIEDAYGFMHDGKGGDTSFNAVYRAEIMMRADAYFLLIGTNDAIVGHHPQETIMNIITIADKLHQKNKDAPILISTLLPRFDNVFNNERNKRVNAMLVALKGQLCKKCYVMDIGGWFVKTKNTSAFFWDGVHLTEQGYVLFAKFFMYELVKIFH